MSTFLWGVDFFFLSLILLQRRIDKFLGLKRIGKSFNAEVRNKKDYRNPDFLLHAVRYQDIDQIGSCFSKDVFDPHGYDKSDYYDEIGQKQFLLQFSPSISLPHTLVAGGYFMLIFTVYCGWGVLYLFIVFSNWCFALWMCHLIWFC